jgi:hypothetical protein
MFRRLTLTLSTVAATGCLCFGIAQAAGGANTTGAAPQTALPATPFHGTLWAVVNSNGTLARGSLGATSNAEGTGTGNYEVIFPQNIRNCSYVVSPGSPGALGVAPSGETSVQGDNDNVGGVFIHLSDHTGANLTDGLHLIVSC